MKKLHIKTQQYQQLEQEFKAWLQTLGHASGTVESLPIYIRELFYYLEQNNKTQIQQATEQDINTFFFQWKKRKNQTTGAGLSNSHINKGTLAYHKFIKYLRVTGKHNLEISLQREENKTQPRVILTKKEIKAMYKAIDTYPEKRTSTTPYRLRDRAMLAVFYGCGLRKNEGSHLRTEDILMEKRMLIVRKGKGNKERYVPITKNNLLDMQEYLNTGRDWFLCDHSQQYDYQSPRRKQIKDKGYFFLNVWGEQMRDFSHRLKILKEECGINKPLSLHVLRHSIATHLLQSGMSLELISKFLGHSTLESTQIYTHIINEL